ncbi:MAG: hypothetical protein NZR01_09075 [Bryobacteraceae bacterium]|nr:hypothetical protein [Bryobacteraceae bacterium]
MRFLAVAPKTLSFLGFALLALHGQPQRDFRALDTPPERTPPAGLFGAGKDRHALLPKAGGVLAHVAVGGPWRTLLVLANPDSTTTAKATLSFYTSQGASLRVTLSNGLKTVEAFAFEIVLPPRDSMFLETVNLPAAALVGYADLQTDSGRITGYGIFRAVLPSGPNLEAVVPLEWGVSDEVILAYDNTRGFVTSVAIANRWLYLPCDLLAEVYDEDGLLLASYRRMLTGGTHTAFETTREWPATAGRRGIVRLSTVGTTAGFAALALLFNPSGSMTTAPVIDLP